MKDLFSRLSWIKLHHAILIALGLGIFFGVYFSVSKYRLEITYVENDQEQTYVIENWQKIDLLRSDKVLASFEKEDQSKILKYFKSLKDTNPGGLIISAVEAPFERGGLTFTLTTRIEDVRNIEKVKTIAVEIKPIGTLFIRLLMFLAIPLVVSSLIVSAASMGDIRKIGRIGGKTLFLCLIMTVVAITIGLVLVNAVQPGTSLSAESREMLMSEFGMEQIEETASLDLIDTIVNIVPSNPFEAMARPDMLQVVFFAVIVGVALAIVAKEKARPVINFFDGLSETMFKLVDLMMMLAPIGVFALIAATIAEFGFDILQTMIWYTGVVVLGLVIHMTLVYGSLVRFGGGISLARFFAGMRDPMLIALTTSSSAATLPVNMAYCERNLGVPKTTTSFVLPLGAAINADGTSMFQAVTAVFIAQVYGLNLHLSDQLTILLTATLASIGTASVPGIGIVMLMIVLRSVHIPAEGIALILGVDRILEMCRTTVNITGDAAVAVVVANSEGVLGESKKEE